MRNRLARQVMRQPLVLPSRQATDAQLAFRYAQLGETAAFEELMRRHGPMVWGVCARLLRRVQDAEDAFQATFLVLARKAGSLRDTQRLPAWLHGVARRTALHLRSRRRDTLPLDETQALANDSVAWEWHEYRGMLDDAIAQLPARLRTAFLLCHAEGLTAALTAKRMNIPEGTVVSRVHRARERLRRYLQRRGVTSAAGAVGASVSLALPEALAGQALRAVLGTSTSALVGSLAQGVIVTMTWIKLATAAVVVSALGLSGAGAALVWAGQDRERPAKEAQERSAREAEARGRDRLAELEAHLKRLRNQVEMARNQEAHARAMAERAEAERVAALTQLKQVQDEAVKFRQSALQQRDQLNQVYQEMNQRRTQEQQQEEKAKSRLVETQRKYSEAQVKLQDELKHLRQELQALAKHDPRLALNNAPELIYEEIIRLQQHLRDLDKQLLAVKVEMRQRLRNSDETDKRAEEAARPILLQMEETKVKLDKAYQDNQRNQAVLQQYKHLQARLALREKLLLEIEERLMRAELGLP